MPHFSDIAILKSTYAQILTVMERVSIYQRYVYVLIYSGDWGREARGKGSSLIYLGTKITDNSTSDNSTSDNSTSDNSTSDVNIGMPNWRVYISTMNQPL